MQCLLRQECPKEIDNRSIRKSRLILGEGLDEKNFFDAFLQHLRIVNVQAMYYGGKTHRKGLLQTLAARQPEFQRVTHLAITADADDNYEGTVQSIKAELEACHLPIPEDRQFATDNGKRVGLYLLRRQLETICLQSLAGASELRCIRQFLECVGFEDERENEVEKVKCRTYLAPKDSAVLSVGVAAKQGYWDFANPAFDGIREFLQTLAG